MAVRATRLSLPRTLRQQIGKWIADAPIEQILVNQAKRRIDRGGDSQVRYKRLWPDKRSFRSGGQPLLDTRQHVYNTLNATRQRTGRSMVYHLRGSLAAVYQHHGFKTSGPNFIPLTRRARRIHRKGNDPRLEGLVVNVDYIIARRGVEVPARPIFRIAPEDRREIIHTLRVAVRRRAGRAA